MKLSIFYTNKCNIACRHCFLGKQEKAFHMSDDLLVGILRQSKKIGISKISFSGGEPLLFWKNISMILERESTDGIKISFSTNAMWASSQQIANEMCKHMRVIGITQLEVSCDEYHQEFVPIQNVYNLIEAANKWDIQTKIVMSVTDDLRYLNLYANLLKHNLTPKQIITQRVAGYGNAKENSIDTPLDAEQFRNIKCGQIMNPCVTYNGDMYACCGPCVVSDQKNPLYVANLSKIDLASAIDAMRQSTRVSKIYTDGPGSLIECKKIKNCSSLCDLCLGNYKEMA